MSEFRYTFRQAMTATSFHMAMAAKVWAAWWKTVAATKPKVPR